MNWGSVQATFLSLVSDPTYLGLVFDGKKKEAEVDASLADLDVSFLPIKDGYGFPQAVLDLLVSVMRCGVRFNASILLVRRGGRGGGFKKRGKFCFLTVFGASGDHYLPECFGCTERYVGNTMHFTGNAVQGGFFLLGYGLLM